VTVGVADGFADDAGELAAASFHSLRIVFIHQESGFYYHHVTVEFFAYMTDIGDAVGDGLVFVSPETAVKAQYG